MDEAPGRWRVLACILVGALLLRGASACALQWSLPPGQLCLIAGDAEGYWELARRIAAGADYAIYAKPRYVLRMPGFPLLLSAVIRLFGEEPLAARLLLAVVGTVACGLVYQLGKELVGHTAGLWASFYCAVSPAMVLFSVMILSETLFAATLLASLIGILRVWRMVHLAATIPNAGSLENSANSRLRSATISASLPNGGIAGILIGLSTLVRPTWLLMGPAAAVVCLLTGRFQKPAWLAAVGILIGLSACMAPWTIRNRGVTGHLIPTTLWVGPSLYDGLSPTADGSSHMEFVERDGVYDRLSEFDADQFYRKKSWEFVQVNPWRTVQLGVVKLARYWSPWPNAAQFQNPVLSAGLIAQFVLLMSTAALGAWTFISNRRISLPYSLTPSLPHLEPQRLSIATRTHALLLTLGPILYFAALHTVFVGSLRYRLPAEYPLSILSAVGVVAVSNWWGQRKGALSA